MADFVDKSHSKEVASVFKDNAGKSIMFKMLVSWQS